MAEQNIQHGTGRRKTAVARVRVKPGKGEITVNKKPMDVFFPRERDRKVILQPLKITDTTEAYDIIAQVHGGGIAGQAGAVRLGIARALLRTDSALEPTLRSNQMLTRDSRKKERKKPGRPGARKSFQFSKR